MRSILILAMFAAGLAQAAFGEYEEIRELELDASGIGVLDIEAGAGSLAITGVAGLQEIRVNAIIHVPTSDEDEARESIESDMVLTLEKSGDRAVLKGYFENRGRGWDDSPGIRLEVQVPPSTGLSVEDGSGSMAVNGVSGDIEIDDGSGSIKMEQVGGVVRIEDGSGSISVIEAGGDVQIRDGSGSITVRGVGGSVTVDDGSGSINVSDVEHDLIIESDGSGGLNYSDIAGRVENES